MLATAGPDMSDRLQFTTRMLMADEWERAGENSAKPASPRGRLIKLMLRRAKKVRKRNELSGLVASHKASGDGMKLTC